MRIIKFFSTKVKKPLKLKSPKKINIFTINKKNKNINQNIDINDLDYSEKFWKNIDKIRNK